MNEDKVSKREKTASSQAESSEQREALHQLARRLTHDLRSGSHAIVAFAEMLSLRAQNLERITLGQETSRYVNEIMHRGIRQGQLARLVTTLSLLQSGNRQMQSVDLHEIANLAWNEASGSRPDARLETGELPFVHANVELVGSLFCSLFEIAVANGRQSISLRAAPVNREGYCRLLLADATAANAESSLLNVEDLTSRTEKRWEVDLLLCHEVVKAHRGHLLVDPDLGRCFSVALPSGK